MASSDVDGGAAPDLPARGRRVSERPAGCRSGRGWSQCSRRRGAAVYNIFRKFQRDGVWEAIWVELYMALRERMGLEASPSAAVLDSQSVKSSGKGR